MALRRLGRVCGVCGLPIEEEDRFKAAVKPGMTHVTGCSFTMSGGVIRVNWHKSCVKEDESAWVRNSRGVVVSKGKNIIYVAMDGTGRIELRR